jgi:dipeptidyl aminopeptidase/acylaminoacyl peptidase
VEIQIELARGLRGVVHGPGHGRRGPGVLLLHGFTGSRIEDGRMFVALGRALAGAGMYALRFDFRGSGDSDGDFAEMTLESELADARAALRHLARTSGVDPDRVGILGVSLGSVVAQLIAAETRAAALVLWATIAQPAEVFTDDKREQAAARGYAASDEFYRQVRDAQPLEALARYPGPLLCVHGEADYVPVGHARAAAATLGARATIHVVAGGDHTFGTVGRKQEAIEVSLRFLARALLEAPASSASRGARVGARSATRRARSSRRRGPPGGSSRRRS